MDVDCVMSKIRNGAIIAYITIVLEIVLGLFYTPWMLSVIGQDNYALYSLGMSLMSFLLLDFGLSNAVTRFMSNYLAAGDQDKVNNLLGLVFKLYFLIDALIVLALVIIWFNLGSIYAGLSNEQLSLFKIVFLILGLFSIVSFPCIPIKGIMRSYENFVELKLCELFNKILSTASIIVLLYIGSTRDVSKEYLLLGLISIVCFWNLFFVGVNLIIIKKKDPLIIKWSFFEKDLFKDVFSFSVWITIIQFFERFFVIITPTLLTLVIVAQAVDKQSVLLGLSKNSATIQVAIFGLASTLEGYAFTFSNSINSFFMPMISRFVYSNNREGIDNLMVIVGKFQSAVIGIIICGFVAIGIPFINYWARTSSYPYLVWLCALVLFIPMLFTRTQIISGIVAEVKNEMKFPSFVYMVTAIIYIASAIVACYYWGALGACVALAIISVIRQVALDIIYVKRLHLDIMAFCKRCYVPMYGVIFITILLTVSFGYLMDNYVSLNQVLSLGLKGGFTMIVYMVLLLTVGMKRSEVMQLVRRR